MAVMALAMASCKEKTTTTNIITKKTEKAAPAAPGKMQPYNQKENVEWLGNTYVVEVKRDVDTALPMIEDDSGNKYYDNKIAVVIRRSDGTEFFNRTFAKDDFSSCTTESYRRKNALLGIVFDKVEGGNLRFVASVGSPDKLSDEYIPIAMTISRLGDVSVKEDTSLDMAIESGDNDDEGV